MTQPTTIYDWYPTRFISAHDLRGRKVTVQIERWKMEEVKRSGADSEVPVIYFLGKQKGMRVNKTNARIIAKLYGPSPDNWIGKWITIHPASGRVGDEVHVVQEIPQPPATSKATDIGAGPASEQPAPETTDTQV